MPLLSNLLSPMSSVLYTMSYVAISPCPIHCVEGQDQCNSMFFSLKKTRLKYDKKLISVSSFLFSLKFSNVQTDSCHYEPPMTDYYILYYADHVCYEGSCVLALPAVPAPACNMLPDCVAEECFLCLQVPGWLPRRPRAGVRRALPPVHVSRRAGQPAAARRQLLPPPRPGPDGVCLQAGIQRYTHTQ
jgi:hypothetical protein